MSSEVKVKNVMVHNHTSKPVPALVRKQVVSGQTVMV